MKNQKLLITLMIFLITPSKILKIEKIKNIIKKIKKKKNHPDILQIKNYFEDPNVLSFKY